MTNFSALLHFLTRGDAALPRRHYSPELRTMTAPRVTPEQVAQAIVATDYVVMPDGRTTICQLTLYNGFTVRGESSCVCIENFDPQIGQDIAKRNATDQVWLLLGFQLADRLHRDHISAPGPAPEREPRA